MGFKKYIPGLKPKASTTNLVVPINNGGYGGYSTSPQPPNTIYSIPESGPGSAAPNQPRTVSGHAIPSFETSRSISSGSAGSYSFTNNNNPNPNSTFGSSTNSLGKTSSISTPSTGVSSLRNFSGASAKSSATATAKPTTPEIREPQVSATDVRRCTKLLRQMFELHLELWTLTYTHGTDQYRRQEKRLQVDAILVDIHHMVGTWHTMPPSTWTEEEYEEIKWIAQTLADLPPPRY